MWKNIIILCSYLRISYGTHWNVSCPHKCSCEVTPSSKIKADLRTVDCTNRKLSQIPLDTPLDTEALLLKGNIVSNVHDHIPKFTELKELDLSSNRLSTLGTQPIFENSTALQYINLDNNQIQTLLHGSFSGLTSLVKLTLKNNEIDYIEDHSFGGLNRLKLLSLSGNKLVTVKRDWFTSMSGLETLLLDHNWINVLEDNSFEPLQKLTKLSLSGNKLQHLSKYTFKGLGSLQNLLLDDNSLETVPTAALTVFKGLKILSMNENPMNKIEAHDFEDLMIYEINLNNMPELAIIDAEAFKHMIELTILQLHDNPKLMYIDPQAFTNLPNLQVLYLHANQLMAIPYVLTAMPRIRELSFHDNPIQCDCNVYWIRAILEHNDTVNHSVTFPQGLHVTCTSPAQLDGKTLVDIPLSQFPKTCSPTAIPFFNDSYHMELGETVSYECRGVGIPPPHVHWILSNGKTVNNTSNYSRVRLTNRGSMTIMNVKALDAGTYTCVCTNSIGYDTTSTVLQIHNKNIHILHKGIATNFVTVTWNGTDSTILSSDYVILYRKVGSDEEYGKIHLQPYMRTYTITNLKPKTMYEFCIAYQHLDELVRLNCLNIKTKHQMYMMQGVKTLGSMTILIALCTTFAFILIICLGTALIKRYQRRKSYNEPDGVNVQKVGHMSQIPLDNLYNPPSTPLCGSRASLIGQSNA